MDPLFQALAFSFATGFSTIAGKLLEKGVVDPSLEPVTAQLKQFVQSGVTASERQRAIADTIRAAVEDSSGESDESLAVKYARRIHLQQLADPNQAAVWNEVVRIVYLAASDDPSIIPDSLMDKLHLGTEERRPLAHFMFYLRRHLSRLPEFRPLFESAHQQSIEAAFRRLDASLSQLVSVFETTPAGNSFRTINVTADLDRNAYLRYLANECNRLRLSVIDPQYVTLTGQSRIALAQVYTNVDVTTLAYVERVESSYKEDQTLASPRSELGKLREKERLTAIEALSGDPGSRIVLLGEPGSGKTTFINYVAFCLSLSQVDSKIDWLDRLPGWTRGKLLPVRIFLRDIAVWWLESGQRYQPSAEAFWRFIEYDLMAHGIGETFKTLRDTFLDGKGLLLLDGLDEVSDVLATRDFIKAAIEDFASACNSMIVVTCRSFAYRDPRWRVEGFSQHTLAPFSEKQIEEFIRRWYVTVAPTEGWDTGLATEKAEALIVACGLPYLSQLASRPLLLTLMTTLHTARGKLPDDRAELYADCVALLLDYWQRGKTTRALAQKGSDTGILNALNIPRTQLEQALAQVAFIAHERQGKAPNREPEAADITGEEIRKILAPMLENSWDKANLVIHYIETRGGLLVGRGLDTFTFPHRTFQEYLAACHVLGSEDFPYNLAEWVHQDRDWWREVFLLAAGRTKATAFGQAVALINALCESNYDKTEITSNENCYSAILAAHAALEIGLPQRAGSPGRYQDTLRKLQNWLISILERSRLPLREKADAGRLLSMLGDPRPTIVCRFPAMISVPAGAFTMGSSKFYEDERPEHQVFVREFQIGQFPVTNAQYRNFVEDGGYTAKRKTCWTDTGWRWLETDEIVEPGYWDDPYWNLDNHPVVGVSWDEAVAYCRWLTLTDTEGRVFRLPTEAEWEKAARGMDGREWPWGNQFELEGANTSESTIGRTTTVGIISEGQSPYGISDMAGNVWEWCSTRWGKGLDQMDFGYPYNPEDGREIMEGEDLRVMRGGAWVFNSSYARCSFRGWGIPSNRNKTVGFRIASSVKVTYGSR